MNYREIALYSNFIIHNLDKPPSANQEHRDTLRPSEIRKDFIFVLRVSVTS